MGHELIKILEEKYPQYKNKFEAADIYFHSHASNMQMVVKSNWVIHIGLATKDKLYGEYLSTAGFWEPMTDTQIGEAISYIFGGPEVLEWLE